LFTTHKIRDLCDTYNALQDTYEKLQRDVVKEVLSITASYFPVLELMNHLIAHLDVLQSFATTVAQAPRPYVRPALVENGDIILKASRHPCVELQDNVSFIENDASFIKGERMFQIITGPNMGGKSTYIRQVCSFIKNLGWS
jgi:DNA mismatch repair protein MSH2